MTVVYVLLRLAFWLFRRIRGSLVPDSAVREMLDRCIQAKQGEEWVLVRFRPNVSLEEARRKVASDTYTEDDRLRGFMSKFAGVAPVRPDIAIYSPQKGYLLASGLMIRTLEEKYGRWMLDTWSTLKGAMAKMGMSACDLDGGQFFVHGRHVGSMPDKN